MTSKYNKRISARVLQNGVIALRMYLWTIVQLFFTEGISIGRTGIRHDDCNDWVIMRKGKDRE
jgi:hypothetical protein